MASCVLRPGRTLNSSLFANIFFIRNVSTNTGIKILAAVTPEHEKVLSPEALKFVTEIHRKFEPTRRELLTARARRQTRIDAGEQLTFRYFICCSFVSYFTRHYYI